MNSEASLCNSVLDPNTSDLRFKYSECKLIVYILDVTWGYCFTSGL